MSYILEALKKADADRERERQAAPGLHSHHAHALPDDAGDTQSSRTPWLISGVAAGVLITGAMFWLIGRHSDPALAPEVAKSATLTARVGEPLPALQAPQPISERPGLNAPPRHAAGASRSNTQQPLKVDPTLRDSDPKIATLPELPDDIRRELPQLIAGGAMHSDVASNRMLILNGGVFREGDQPAPGVMLEQIRLKSAVLRYKGHRYSINY